MDRSALERAFLDYLAVGGFPEAQELDVATRRQLLRDCVLSDCFLVRTVWLEAKSERQRMVDPRKAYPVDPGLIPIFDRTGRANAGHKISGAPCGRRGIGVD